MPEDPKTTGDANEYANREANSENWTPRRGGQASPSRSGSMKSLAQAEELMQIAFVLPSGMLLGWGAGYVADKIMHTHWATVTGLILGIVLGMVSVIRTATAAMKRPGTEKSDAKMLGSSKSGSSESGRAGKDS
ncbi:AtpZ/AtpI family protein [Acidicapsa dinghuensis]|uniref:AtpZ/AtpI family protein n=1 Tax=Acidicapsa dinghuensis TaxID=2218256 RepID=A0ABW1EJZ9_9BACT|nr:AtpZ/AtpI family protein [Acidicapsa dinghuensis]